MSEKILVTGADGFIGSHLVESLVVKGFKVKVLVYYNSHNIDVKSMYKDGFNYFIELEKKKLSV